MQRIQRLRTKGWRMPPNSIYLGRPTRWGNPYKPEDFEDDLPACLDAYRLWLHSQLERGLLQLVQIDGCAYGACWCKLDVPCHVDVIIEELEKWRAAHGAL